MANKNRQDITHQRFGKLVAIERMKDSHWLCQCDCGNRKEIRLNNLNSGDIKSCGCLRFEKPSKYKNGVATFKTSEYYILAAMMDRCYNQNNKKYSDYGGRGIKVCDRWLKDKRNFLLDMGPKPGPKYSIDRINNDGDYSPENCKWATRIEQMNNTRKNVFLEYNGKRMTVSQWGRELNINTQTLWGRINAGWSNEKILTVPVKRKN